MLQRFDSRTESQCTPHWFRGWNEAINICFTAVLVTSAVVEASRMVKRINER